MKSITIHGIDAELEQKITEIANETGYSQNRTIKYILQKTLKTDKKVSKRDSFLDLFGTWSDEEKKDFETRISDFETIQISDWK
ncbi:hypothetical protein [Gracilinema caldarium]|uniref:hypothetical protein n=1 Tax=Gracilinema caldarium TaxID=215591 RepID=UPI0026EF9092|nr:hypothetical protein [Gracilinema caldarium]